MEANNLTDGLKGDTDKLSKKGILIGAGIGTAGIVFGTTVSRMITKDLIEIALTRNEPKIMNKMKTKISRSEKISDFRKQIEEAGALLLEKNTEEVEIRSRDGLRLVGHWYPCENARRVLIAMHGWRSAWYKDFGMIADFWHNEGCSVLFAEQRGQNGSDGEYMTFGHMERYDCLEWISWVNKRTEKQYPIYLVGLSMGASTVLMAAGLDLPENTKGVIADCGFTSAYEIWRHVVRDNMKLSYRLRDHMVDRICMKKIHTNARDISTVTAMKNAEIPILFIHGTEDTFVPIRMTYENYKACRAPKELLIVPGAIHAQSYYLEKERYEAATRAFWSRYV